MRAVFGGVYAALVVSAVVWLAICLLRVLRIRSVFTINESIRLSHRRQDMLLAGQAVAALGVVTSFVCYPLGLGEDGMALALSLGLVGIGAMGTSLQALGFSAGERAASAAELASAQHAESSPSGDSGKGQ